MAVDKFGTGPRAWRALASHGIVVGLTLVPLVLAFGLPGLAYLLVTTLTHIAIDRAKIVLTRRSESAAAGNVEEADVPQEPDATLGVAWTPAPATLFVVDQLVHIAVLFVAWSVLLSGAELLDLAARAGGALMGQLTPDLFHRTTLTVLVITILVIVNVRAASLFVATLVQAHGSPSGADGGSAAEHVPAARTGVASPAKLGATIGVLERLVVVALVLAGQASAIGLVIAAKTLARFKQLDDRRFAEYYLVGTLASVSVALVTGLLAVAVLGPLLER